MQLTTHRPDNTHALLREQIKEVLAVDQRDRSQCRRRSRPHRHGRESGRCDKETLSGSGPQAAAAQLVYGSLLNRQVAELLDLDERAYPQMAPREALGRRQRRLQIPAPALVPPNEAVAPRELNILAALALQKLCDQKKQSPVGQRTEAPQQITQKAFGGARRSGIQFLTCVVRKGMRSLVLKLNVVHRGMVSLIPTDQLMQ